MLRRDAATRVLRQTQSFPDQGIVHAVAYNPKGGFAIHGQRVHLGRGPCREAGVPALHEHHPQLAAVAAGGGPQEGVAGARCPAASVGNPPRHLNKKITERRGPFSSALSFILVIIY